MAAASNSNGDAGSEFLQTLAHWSSPGRSIIFSFLEPIDLAACSAVNSVAKESVEQWCKVFGVPGAIKVQLAMIERIQSDPAGRLATFHSYKGFLLALQRSALDSAAVNVRSWRRRLIAARRPRPRRFTQKYDWGYPGGYWCDAFGCGGVPNDYIRQVGNNPTIFWQLGIAGADQNGVVWGGVQGQQGDRPLRDPPPRPTEQAHEPRAYIRTSQEPTSWDHNSKYWDDTWLGLRGTRQVNEILSSRYFT